MRAVYQKCRDWRIDSALQRKGVNVNRVRKGLLLIAVLAMAALSLSIGAQEIVWSDVADPASISHVMFFKSRVPRTLSIVIAGFGMSISGLIYQQISRNKFVSPTTAGSVSGAQLGIALSIALFGNLPTVGKMGFAFGFSLLVTGIFMAIMSRLKFKERIYVPLLGMMLGSFVSAITTFIAYRSDALQVLQGWFLGSFSLVTSGRYELLWLVVPAILLSYLYAKAFTIAGMGENFAVNLGLNYQKVVGIGMGLISLVSASVVIVVGSIPFLGLVIPNLVSLYAGDNLEKNLLDVGLLGTLFLLASDVLCRRIIYPYELPIALVVGVLGCGIFLGLVIRREVRHAA